MKYLRLYDGRSFELISSPKPAYYLTKPFNLAFKSKNFQVREFSVEEKEIHVFSQQGHQNQVSGGRVGGFILESCLRSGKLETPRRIQIF